VGQAESAIEKMERIAGKSLLPLDTQKSQINRLRSLKRRLARFYDDLPEAAILTRMKPKERGTVQRILSLIYECTPNENEARSLVAQILQRLR
jgi:hypothetical protein